MAERIFVLMCTAVLVIRTSSCPCLRKSGLDHQCNFIIMILFPREQRYKGERRDISTPLSPSEFHYEGGFHCLRAVHKVEMECWSGSKLMDNLLGGHCEIQNGTLNDTVSLVLCQKVIEL